MGRRLSIRAVLTSALASTLVVGAMVVPAEAAGPRPFFQAPFQCGSRVKFGTYPGHGDYEIDMIVGEGTPVLAAAAGRAYRGHSTTGGYQVSILHGNGWRTLYLHLKANTYQFNDGDWVAQGQRVASSGNTGTKTSGPHLHFEQQNQFDGSWRAVHAWFNGRASDITDDARANSYYETSQNGCAPAPPPQALQVSAVHADTVSHTVRTHDGAWDEWGAVESQAGALSDVHGMASAVVNGELHLVAAHGDGISHTIRHANARWEPWRSVETPAGNLPRLTGLTAVATGVDLQVVAVHGDEILHTARYGRTAAWEPWRSVETATGGDLSGVTEVAAASVSNELQLVVVHGAGVSHTVRRISGQWTGWGDVERAAGALGTVTAVTAAGTGADLQIVVVDGDQLKHAARHGSNGGWLAWGNVESQAGSVGGITGVAAASVNNEFQLLVANGDRLSHTVRHVNARWEPWGNVEGEAGNLNPVTSLTATGG
ncbi:peptidoglycan DD-metalloendopeptidase family protein [Plantactinospora sonchi]|uniref:Peptidoglycan DD-metalloendopeptidase family protein n=1 Tax=Plantactinospora sonchi TaxID=1544735 RepID=A0ABU7RNT0_9ACTN